MIEPHKFVSNCRVPGCTSAHYFCQVPECGVPATDTIHQHPAEGLSASQQDSLEYARGWVGHLDDNPIANDHNNCVIAAFEELAQAKRRIAELEAVIEQIGPESQVAAGHIGTPLYERVRSLVPNKKLLEERNK